MHMHHLQVALYSDEFENERYNQAKLHKHLLEANMENPLFVFVFIPNEILNNNITLDKIHDIVTHAKSHSASGYDENPYRVLKYPIIIETLHNTFQLVFDTSIIPSVWRKAIICPILKDYSTDPRVPMNYRGVSLLSCISKLYSAFINKRLSCYLGDSDLLADEQNGFRRNRSCEDHVFSLNCLIRNNDSLFVAFIDLKKCFNLIDRDMMLYKLLLNNIDGKIYNSISSIYQNSESCVRLNGKLTDWFICETGVKQGDNLSPTLFAVFINDLVKELNDQDMGINIVDKKL